MPAIHIRDVPEATIATLRERAKHAGISMQAELHRILEEAAASPPAHRKVAPIQLVTARTPGTATWRREDMYDEGR